MPKYNVIDGEHLNQEGAEFLRQVQSIVDECNSLPPERRAHVTAFSILVLLDGSGESIGAEDYRVFIQDGENLTPVKFWHHRLGG